MQYMSTRLSPKFFKWLYFCKVGSQVTLSLFILFSTLDMFIDFTEKREKRREGR